MTKLVDEPNDNFIFEGTTQELSAAVLKAIRNMTEEQKAKIREQILWRVYGPKIGSTIQ